MIGTQSLPLRDLKASHYIALGHFGISRYKPVTAFDLVTSTEVGVAFRVFRSVTSYQSVPS